MTTTSLKLNTGADMPVLGLGTWKSKPGEVEKAVKVALDIGYKHIDCAYVYENEKEIGKALADSIGTTIARKDLFVTSKLWITMLEPKHVRKGVEMSLKNLGLEYLDLYLIHWPHGLEFQGYDVLIPKDDKGEILLSYFDYKDTWRAMEELVDEGLVKAIGVSNFNTLQVDDIIQNCNITPAVNQIEAHPRMTCNRWIRHCQEKNIVVTAYAPLGSGDRPGAAQSGVPVLLEDPVIKSIAAKYGKSPAQICLRHGIQRNLVVIPKSVTPARIKANSQVFDFQLSKEDMQAINGINKNIRYCEMPKEVDGKAVPLFGEHPAYSFNDPNYD